MVVEQVEHSVVHERNLTQNQHKKLKPGLVASYDIRRGNGVKLF